MIVINIAISDQNEIFRLDSILQSHPDAFAWQKGVVKRCYFLNENSDAMMLLSRLFMRYDNKIHAYEICHLVDESDIPNLYSDYVKEATDGKGIFRVGKRSKDTIDDWNRMRNLEKKVELKL